MFVSADGKIKGAIAVFEVNIKYEGQTLATMMAEANDSHTAEKCAKGLFLALFDIKEEVIDKIIPEAMLVSFK